MNAATLTVALCCGVLLACGDPPPAEHTAVHDSAGVRIVESAAPVWRDSDAWRVAASPSLQIGVSEGSPHFQFFRVQDVRRRTDGNILVVNAGTQEVRMFSPEGDYVRTIGRSGSGPGEFQSPRSLWLGPNDTILVGDLERMSAFDSAGTFARSTPFANAYQSHALDDRTYIRLVFAPSVNPIELGHSRPDYSIIRLSADAQVIDTLTQITGTEVYRQFSTGEQIYNFNAPFGAERMIATHGHSIFTGDGKGFIVSELNDRGQLRRILRRAYDPEPVTPEAIASFEASMLDLFQLDEQKAQIRRLFTEWSYPRTQPQYDRLVIDKTGGIWLRHFHIDARRAATWSVLDTARGWLGEIMLPASVVVKEIGDEYILGVRIDDLGVEYIMQYAH